MRALRNATQPELSTRLLPLSMQYLKNKREQFGACNICGKDSPLTWDHVPPKGGIELTPVQMESVFRVLTGNNEGFKAAHSQNGVKYRTICKSCNETMGRRYDAALNEFALSVGRYLKTQLSLPPIIQHNTRPAALIRGILGHLVSAKIERDEAVLDKQISPLILDESLPIPDDIHIFYWIFPYDFICIVRDVAIVSLTDPTKSIHYCHFIKYFPIAYLVSNKPAYDGLEELTKFRNASIDDEIAIPIRLNQVKPIHWPEMVEDAKVMLGGQSLMNSVFASRKTKKAASVPRHPKAE
ncbi:MAG: hypothetical protein HYR76_08130 [Ignavibacteria bacterium]|nr:hypothetical protein [Ignavibacteria bacterium]MBI3766489.1 hypothetical protein [Ignavibacteriales bacterium]